MKNISLIALLAAMTVTPESVLAFSDATINKNTEQGEVKKAVTAALGHEATQADLALAATLPAGTDINADNMKAASALAEKSLPVDAANVAAAVALAAIPLPVNAANVAAAVALAPMVNAGVALDAAKVNALLGAANDGVYNAMAWAMNNGFAGRPIGTIPAGIAKYNSNTPAGHPRFIVEHGNTPFGANKDRFDGPGKMRFKVHGTPHTYAGKYIVFMGLADDPAQAEFVTLTNGATAP